MLIALAINPDVIKYIEPYRGTLEFFIWLLFCNDCAETGKGYMS
jgi:hypothetical protein